MKILLIRPPRTKEMVVMGFPLNLMSIASFLKNENHNTKIIDYDIIKYSEEQLKEIIETYEPVLIGITGINMQKEVIYQISIFIKNLFKSIPIVVGGPIVSCERENVLKEKSIDFAVIGEGEITLLKLINSLEKNKSIDKIKGLIHRKKEGIVFNGERELYSNIDEFRINYDLINVEDYFRTRTLSRLFTSSKRCIQLMTSRGCPFSCIYCSKVFGDSFRARSFESIVQEIDELVVKYKIEELIVEDENFLLYKDRAIKILEHIIKNKYKLKIQFPNGLHVNTLDEEIIKKLKEAGTHYLSLGIESGTKRVQKIMKKGLDLDKTRKIVDLIKQYGIKVNGFFMIGFPFESESEIYETIKYASSLKLDSADFSIVRAYTNTELYRVYTDRLVPEKRLKQLRVFAYFLFYTNKLRILKHLYVFNRIVNFLKRV